MRRTAQYTLLDQAVLGNWDSFVDQDHPCEQEAWTFENHNFLQLICVKKAPLKVFQKYLPRMTSLINEPLYRSGCTPLHLLMEKDYFFFPGNPEYTIDENALIEIVRCLIEGGADTGQKNRCGETPYDIAKKNGMSQIVLSLLQGSVPSVHSEKKSLVKRIFNCCFDV